MNTSPFFSVVIPVYNKGPHVKRAITSVLNQTFLEFELILVNDASTDNSLEEMQKFTDSRIRTLHRDEPGPGGYAARNLGIKEARAEWVAFLDADDEWTPEHLENMHIAVNSCPDVGLFASGWISFFGKQKHEHGYFNKSKHKGIHKINLRQYLETAEQGLRFCSTPIVVLNRTKVMRVGGFPEGRTQKGGDLYAWIIIIAHYGAAWSPHQGAIVHRDAVNMVTESSFFRPALFTSLANELDGLISNAEIKLLKKYVNSLLVKDYLRRCARFGDADFNLLQHCFLFDLNSCIKITSINLIPPSLILALNNLRSKLKKLTNNQVASK